LGVLGIGALGGVQAMIGWIMVASGLKEGMVAVAPIKLMLHLTTAAVIFTLLVIVATRFTPKADEGAPRGIKRGGVILLLLTLLQIALGAWLAIEGAITGGMVIAASMLIGKAISPLSNLITEWNQIISARQAYDRLNDLLKDDLIYGEQMALPAPGLASGGALWRMKSFRAWAGSACRMRW
jgi:heme A synthase